MNYGGSRRISTH